MSKKSAVQIRTIALDAAIEAERSTFTTKRNNAKKRRDELLEEIYSVFGDIAVKKAKKLGFKGVKSEGMRTIYMRYGPDQLKADGEDVTVKFNGGKLILKVKIPEAKRKAYNRKIQSCGRDYDKYERNAPYRDSSSREYRKVTLRDLFGNNPALAQRVTKLVDREVAKMVEARKAERKASRKRRAA